MTVFRLFLIITICHLPTIYTKPCKVEDTDCMKIFLNDLIKTKFDMSFDPFFIQYINVSLSDIKIIFQNVTAIGFNKCVINNIRSRTGVISYDLVCPALTMTSKYEGNGRILVLPMDGKGNAKFVTGEIIMSIESDYKKMQKSDGKNHFQFKNIKFKAIATQPLQIELTNLFNGQKDLSDTFLKFAHDNWKLLSELLLVPILQPCFEVLVKSKNKYLSSMKTYEDIIIE